MPMPETKTVELRTDTIEKLVTLLETDVVNVSDPLMTRDRRKAVAERIRRQTDGDR